MLYLIIFFAKQLTMSKLIKRTTLILTFKLCLTS